jgi:hypothetical protein
MLIVMQLELLEVIVNDLETIKHRLKLLWYHGESRTYYGCWSSSDIKVYNWVLDNKYQYLDNISTRGLV